MFRIKSLDQLNTYMWFLLFILLKIGEEIDINDDFSERLHCIIIEEENSVFLPWEKVNLSEVGTFIHEHQVVLFSIHWKNIYFNPIITYKYKVSRAFSDKHEIVFSLPEVSDRRGPNIPPGPGVSPALPEPLARHLVPHLLGVNQQQQSHHVRRGLSAAIESKMVQFSQNKTLLLEPGVCTF